MYCQVCLDHWFPGISMGCVSYIQQVFGVVICRLCYHPWSHDSIQLMNIVTTRIYRRLQTSKIWSTRIHSSWILMAAVCGRHSNWKMYSTLFKIAFSNRRQWSHELDKTTSSLCICYSRFLVYYSDNPYGHTMHIKGEQKWADQTKHVPQSCDSEGEVLLKIMTCHRWHNNVHTF